MTLEVLSVKRISASVYSYLISYVVIVDHKITVIWFY